ncbi:hypothetical protein ACH5RR_002671 [Cinchona calisaya]|uniref:MULE transposase domain-containing protein n=1 Tax=Cinchona calisaya TaxID=153742 RepID=A0ABD3ASN1_9GENT
METLPYNKNLEQLKPDIPIPRGRGRPRILNKQALVQAKPGVRRGRGRPRKQHDEKVTKPLIDVLSKQIFKKPRTKTKLLGAFSGVNYFVPSNIVPSKAPEDVKILGSVIPNFDTSKFSVNSEASPSKLPNCVCYQPFSGIEIPGPIPNFDTWEFDYHLLSNFFEDIPDISSSRGRYADMDGGLRQINGDIDVMDMFAMHVGNQKINFYIENLHNVDGLAGNAANEEINHGVGWRWNAYRAADNPVSTDDVEFIVGSEGNSSDISTSTSHFFCSDDEDNLINKRIHVNAHFDGDMVTPCEQLPTNNVPPAIPVMSGIMVNDISSDNDRQDSPVNFKDEGNHVDFPIFDEERDMANPILQLKALESAARREYIVFVSRIQIYRAKRKALKAIEGNQREQYTRVRDYCPMMLQQNRGSIAFVSVNRYLLDSTAIFQRMFVMFNAQRREFLSDGNNQMYSIAKAIVEAELKDSWTWFLQTLIGSIGIPEKIEWVFISNRQKGLKETFKFLMPGVEYRFCVRHQYANFMQLYKGQDLKDLKWGVASAYTIEEFNNPMIALTALNEPGHDWLILESPNTWAMCHFSTRSKCDMKQNEMIEKCNGFVSPKIINKVENLKSEATNWEVTLAEESMFEVVNSARNFIVDLDNRICTCRKYDLSEYIASKPLLQLLVLKGTTDFVHEYYKKEVYLNSNVTHKIGIGQNTTGENLNDRAIRISNRQRDKGKRVAGKIFDWRNPLGKDGETYIGVVIHGKRGVIKSVSGRPTSAGSRNSNSRAIAGTYANPRPVVDTNAIPRARVT